MLFPVVKPACLGPKRLSNTGNMVNSCTGEWTWWVSSHYPKAFAYPCKTIPQQKMPFLILFCFSAYKNVIRLLNLTCRAEKTGSKSPWIMAHHYADFISPSILGRVITDREIQLCDSFVFFSSLLSSG